ncbi:isochorismatase family protein [Methanococcoides sp. SA1]|nr:isochorismatase family protein [Methanococcoides sp. SA1]
MSIDNFMGREKVGIVVVDMQPKFLRNIPSSRKLVAKQLDFIKNYSDVPIIGVQLNPKKNGEFIPSIRNVISDRDGKIVDKDGMSCFLYSEDFENRVEDWENLFFIGVYASWCVWESCYDAGKNYGKDIGTHCDLIADAPWEDSYNINASDRRFRWYRENVSFFDE